ncbi:MAG TPA: hypothetical protein VIK81_00500 [Patescibacteria group bacterium]
MSSLTDTALTTKKFLLGAAIFTIGAIILWTVFGLGRQLYRAINPPPPPAFEVKFGKIAPIQFSVSEEATTSAAFTYQLDTVDGKTPNLGDRAKVFPIVRPLPSLLAVERASEKLNRTGFKNPPTAINDRIYLYTDPEDNKRTIKYDVVSNQFNLSYNFVGDAEFLQKGQNFSTEEATRIARSLLSSLQVFEKDLEKGEIKTSLYKIEGDKISPALSLSEADFIRVNFYREQLDEKIPLISDSFDKAPVSILVSSLSNLKKQIVQVDYNYLLIDRDTGSTYPIKTSTKAYQELEQGFGFVINKSRLGGVTIRNITLGYLDPRILQDYIQPVYVFEGDNNFLAVVPAVDGMWIKSDNSQ